MVKPSMHVHTTHQFSSRFEGRFERKTEAWNAHRSLLEEGHMVQVRLDELRSKIEGLDGLVNSYTEASLHPD